MKSIVATAATFLTLTLLLGTTSAAFSQSEEWDDWEDSEGLNGLDHAPWAVGGTALFGISTHAGETSSRGPFDNPGLVDRVAGGISEGGYKLEELIGSWALELEVSKKAAANVYGGVALGLDSRGYGGSPVSDSAADDGAYRTTYVSLGVRMSVKRAIYAGLSFCVPVSVAAPGASGPDVADSDLSAAIAVRVNVGIQAPIADIGAGSLRFVFDFSYMPMSLFTFKTTMIDDDDNEVPVTIDGPATWSMRFGLSHVVPL